MLRAQLGLALGILVFGVVAAELYVRMSAPVPGGRLLPLHYDDARIGQIADGMTYLRFDQELGWVLAPGWSRLPDGVPFRTNSQGMRADREFSPTMQPGVRRLEAFGDSFTDCRDVPQDECWVTRLEESWPGTEILNFGVSDYGLDQAWLHYQREGRQFATCTVLIGYSIESIERVVNRFPPFISAEDSIPLSTRTLSISANAPGEAR